MKVIAIFAVAAAIAVASVSLLAHQETFKGTVIAVESTNVRVNVVDSTTRQTTPRTFYFDAETRILRGDALVTGATARIRVGENIAVTTDHDLDEELALVIRLDAAK